MIIWSIGKTDRGMWVGGGTLRLESAHATISVHDAKAGWVVRADCRSLRDEKRKGSDKGSDKGSGKGRSRNEYRDLSATPNDEAVWLRSR
jgi:hypothetical protein